jgi:hypothetical protein
MITFTEEQLNEIIFPFINGYVEFLKENKYKKVTLKGINNFIEDYKNEIDVEEFLPVINQLLDYSVSYETDGDHKNDGQMVEYTFNFKNYLDDESYITTEMCLMCGWNHNGDETIK